MQGTTTHESLFSSLVEFSPSGMVLVDGQGRILLVNRAVEECFGYSRDELLGKHVEELLPSRLRQGHQSLRQAFLRSPSTRPMGSGRDLYAARKDGSEF
ncbi:MAG: PAS domain S-box protein, partial [Candidatus Cloacimonetes bacterium]|nr:PAS domain S-box protein [Candidatus Cloacimonadota bacterium]